LSCLVHNEGCSLGLLLGNLLGLNGGCEFGREGKVLSHISQKFMLGLQDLNIQLERHRQEGC
jgi:hypothetical protein